MDDGHQNPSVAKTLSLVVVDGETRGDEWPFGDGAVFPAGPMREPLNAGLARADAVIVLLPADLPQADPQLLALFGGKPVLIARLAPVGPPPPGAAIRVRGHRQAVEGRARPEGRRLRARRIRPLPRPRRLSTRGPLSFLAKRAAELRRGPGHHREGLGAPAARMARQVHRRLAGGGGFRGRGGLRRLPSALPVNDPALHHRRPYAPASSRR
jgi:tetraacyldisaccharide 4'-kinase